MALLPVELPEVNKPVIAIIKHFNSWSTVKTEMIAVDEDDCNWRFLNDKCELSNEHNVVYWEYIKE